MIREQTIQLANYELATLQLGHAADAELTVVFLHGWLDNAASFSSVLAECATLRSNVHYIAIDLPGHGKSAHRQSDNFYPFHDYIDDVHQLLANLSANKLIIVGHSLGALIGCCYSAAFPEQVDGLIQIEGFGPLAEKEDNSVARLRKGILSRRQIAKKRQREFSSLADMVSLRANLNGVTEQQISPLVERASYAKGEKWQWRHDVKLQADSLYRMSFLHADTFMKSVTCPQTIILGDEGFSYLSEQVLSYLEEGKNINNQKVKVERLSGGHHCHIQQPKLTSKIILDLVNKI